MENHENLDFCTTTEVQSDLVTKQVTNRVLQNQSDNNKPLQPSMTPKLVTLPTADRAVPLPVVDQLLAFLRKALLFTQLLYFFFLGESQTSPNIEFAGLHLNTRGRGQARTHCLGGNRRHCYSVKQQRHLPAIDNKILVY